MEFNGQLDTNAEIGSIITEIDLETLDMDIEQPANTQGNTVGITPEVKTVLQEVKDAPLEEKVVEETPANPIAPKEKKETSDPYQDLLNPVNPAEKTAETPEEIPQETPTVETPEETTPSDNTGVYKSFAKAIYEEGVISDFNEEEFVTLAKELGSPAKALIELNKRTIQKYAKAEIDSYPDAIKKLATNYKEGVPLDELIELRSQQTRLATISDEKLGQDKDLSKNLIIQDLVNRGFTEGEAGEEYELYVESAIDDKRAVQARDRLVAQQEKVIQSKAEEAQTRRDQRAVALEESRKTLKSSIDTAKEFIPGVDISTREKSLVYNALTKPVARDGNGSELNEIMMARAKNPVHFDTMVAYLYTKGLFNVDKEGKPTPKVEELFKGKTTETINTLEKELNTFNSKFGEQGNSVVVGDEPAPSDDHIISKLMF